MSGSCPFHGGTPATPRHDLPEMPVRIAALPLDERGYPVPFFVAWIDGKPDFRVADPAKWIRCVKEELCWVCGGRMGAFKVFPIGPMCAISRTTAEPPCHLDCAEWSVKACPFLTRPHMVRREDESTEELGGNVGGIMLKRNPGVTCLWVCKGFKVWRDDRGFPLITVGAAERVSWWREGRKATREEVLQSIESGLPNLLELCDTRAAVLDLQRSTEAVVRNLVPDDREEGGDLA